MDEWSRWAGQSMNINIPDEIIREFLGGVSAVVAVIATGAILFFLSRRIARKLPFTRMGLVLALAPLSLINFLGNSESTALPIYAMIMTLLGISIDGINHLLLFKDPSPPAQNPEEQEEETVEPNPGVMVWEKAVNKCLVLAAMLLVFLAVLFVSTFSIFVGNTHTIDERVKELIDTNEKHLSEISDKFEEHTHKQSEKTTSTSTEVIKYLESIDKVQEEITELSGKVALLQEMLTDKHSHGDFGEAQLSAPTSNRIPENNDSLQQTFDDGVRADSVLFHPEPTSTICIDSEFPIESYVRMTDATLSDADRKTAEQQFLQEIKISTKTFWIAIDKSHMLGKYRKAQSMKILESMQAEYFPVEIEVLKKFINNDCKTNP